MGWISRLIGRETAAVVASIRHGMDRRSFLKTALLGSVAAATLDVEQLLWTPKTQIVVPDMRTVSLGISDWVETNREILGAERFVTPEWMTREALRLLEHELAFTRILTNPYPYDGVGCVGDVVKIPKPQRFLAPSDEMLIVPQNIVMEVETVQLDHQVSVCFDMIKPTMPREMASKTIIQPAVAALADRMRRTGMNVITDLPHDSIRGVPYAGVCRNDALSIRGVQAYDIACDRELFRLDVLGGHSDVIAAEEG